MIGLAYRLPPHQITVHELEQRRQLNSSATTLREFGFESCYVSTDQSLIPLLIECGREVIDKAKVAPDHIRRIFLYSGLGDRSEFDQSEDMLARFRYSVAQLRHELELPHANALAVSQQGCSGLLSLIELSRQLLSAADSDEAVLCLAADFLPRPAKREIMYNLMSDAAGAVLVAENAPKNRIVHFCQSIQSYYWDTPAHADELLAAYFPIAKQVIEQTIEEAGLKKTDIKYFVPHNVSRRSWEILVRLIAVPTEKIWTDNIRRIGHTVSCDHVINLVDMEKQGVIDPGDYLVLFTFGFGATWTCMIVQH